MLSVGLIFRKSVKVGKNTRLNFSKSGVSASTRKGPVSISSRGKITIRLGKGISWRL